MNLQIKRVGYTELELCPCGKHWKTKGPYLCKWCAAKRRNEKRKR